MFIDKNQNRINPKAVHVVDGVTYDGNILDFPDAVAALGITEIADPERKDDKFYYVTDKDDAPYVVNTPKPLDQVKNAIWEKIKAHRDTSKSGGAKVTVSGVDYWFHSDADSRIQQLGLKDQARDVLAAGGTETDVLQKLGQDVSWKTMSGAYVPMTVQLAIDVVAAVGNLDAVLFTVAEQHRNAINALANVDAIAAYDWRTNWPDTYQPE